MMNEQQQQAFQQAMSSARQLCQQGRWGEAFPWLEQAHILGQRSTMAHVTTHFWMLRVGWHQRDWSEIRGQLLRIPAALLMSRVWVPVGNTGGANVNPLKPLPLPESLKMIMEKR
ncbi:MAG: DUF3703 domain-containing protein [Alcanivorax nanhaiticus]